MSDQMDISLLAHFAFASQLSLGIVFLLSALPKLRQPLAFARSVVAYDILPVNVSYVVGIVLIPLEAFLAIAFLTSYWTSLALPLAAILLIAFFVAVGINVHRGRKIACGCFGNATEQISPRTLTRLLLLLCVVLLLAAFRSMGNSALPDLTSMTTDRSVFLYLLQTLFLAVFLILLGAWILSLPEIMLLMRHLSWHRSTVDNTVEGHSVEGT